MEPQFWHERWQRNEIGFHQDAPHPSLDRHWSALALPAGSRVFVPLAGKSHDLLWLAERGHEVVGIELSKLAVQQFNAELAAAPQPWQQRIDLRCGDFFALDAGKLGPIDAVFDRAALIALPAAMRGAYARQMLSLLQPRTRLLLVTLEYDPSQMSGPPHSVGESEVRALYGHRLSVEMLTRDEQLADFPKFAERGVRALSEVTWSLAALAPAQPAQPAQPA